MLRLGVHLVAAGDGADFYATIFRGVAGDQFVERVLYRDFFVAERGGELLDGGRFVGGVDDGFEGCFAFVVGHGRGLQFTVCRSPWKGVRAYIMERGSRAPAIGIVSVAEAEKRQLGCRTP